MAKTGLFTKNTQIARKTDTSVAGENAVKIVTKAAEKSYGEVYLDRLDSVT